MIGLSLDNNHDLHIDETGNLVLARDHVAIAQHAKQRVMSFTGEWFLNVTAGLPWVDQILTRPYNPAVGDSLIKAEIAYTPGVESIEAFSVTPVTDRTRNLKVKAELLVQGQIVEIAA